MSLSINRYKRSFPIQPINTDSKSVLRAHFRKQRQQLNQVQREHASAKATEHFIQHALFSDSHHIAVYIGVHSEMKTDTLINAIWESGKQCYLPVLSHDSVMDFLPYYSGDSLTDNQFGIPEPKQDGLSKVTIEQLDVIIMPLVAFDGHGHRLGAGGGYYDKTLAALGRDSNRPYRVGWAFSQQEADDLPHDAWDVNLHAVVTEYGYREFL